MRSQEKRGKSSIVLMQIFIIIALAMLPMMLSSDIVTLDENLIVNNISINLTALINESYIQHNDSYLRLHVEAADGFLYMLEPEVNTSQPFAQISSFVNISNISLRFIHKGVQYNHYGIDKVVGIKIIDETVQDNITLDEIELENTTSENITVEANETVVENETLVSKTIAEEVNEIITLENVTNVTSDTEFNNTGYEEFIWLDLDSLVNESGEISNENISLMYEEESIIAGIISPRDNVSILEPMQIVLNIDEGTVSSAIATVESDSDIMIFSLETNSQGKYESEFFSLADVGEYNVVVELLDIQSMILDSFNKTFRVVGEEHAVLVPLEDLIEEQNQTKEEARLEKVSIEVLSPLKGTIFNNTDMIQCVADIKTESPLDSVYAIFLLDDLEITQQMFDFNLDGKYETDFFNALYNGEYEIKIIATTASGFIHESNTRFIVGETYIPEGREERRLKKNQTIKLKNKGDIFLRQVEVFFDVNENITLREELAVSLDTKNDSVKIAKLIIENLTDSVKEIEFNNIEINETLDLDIEDLNDPFFEQSYAIDPERINFTDATVTVEAKGTTLYKCEQWNFAEQRCYGEWKLFRDDLIPGKNYTFILTPNDPAFGEKIEVLNVKSYPVVGDNWVVKFVTYGNDDLIISPAEGTTWETQEGDLEFLDIRCGETVQNYEVQGDSIIIRNYECNETSYERSRVLTHGPHTLSFTFGDKTVYARNKASDKYDNISQIYASTYGQVGSSEITVNLDTDHHMFESFYREILNPDRLYINVTDTYKISYGCTWLQTDAAARAVPENWINKNGIEVSPSRSSCYTRDSETDRNRCSNSGTLLLDLTVGDYLELKGMLMSGGGLATGVQTEDDCWMYVSRLRNRAAQYYDATGNQDIDSGALVVNLDTETYMDPTFFTHSADEITVSNDGWYKTFYKTCIDNPSQQNRITVHGWLRENGVTAIPGTDSYAYIRDDAYGQRTCVENYGIHQFTSGDYVEIMSEKSQQEGSGASYTVASQSWLLVELINDSTFMAYDSAGGQSIADGATTAITFDTESKEDSLFTHSTGASSVAVNKNGLYEISYSLGWQDDGGNDRVITCAYLRINGTTAIVPSRQCDFSRGDTQALWNTVSGNIVYNLTNGSTVELVAVPTGSAVTVQANTATLSLVKLSEVDKVPPEVTLNTPLDGLVDDSWPFVNVTFNCSATDNEDLANVSLYITSYNNQSFALNRTSTLSGKFDSAQWRVELPVGNYTWNCLAKDKTGNPDFDTNRTFKLNFTDTTSPWFNPVLVNQFRESGVQFDYDVNGTDNYIFGNYSIDNPLFSITQEGFIQNISHLDVGVYSINITINDSYSNTHTEELLVTIQDTTPPEFITIYNFTAGLGFPISKQFTASDLNGVQTWTVNDTTSFKISATGLFENNTYLPENTYHINVTVIDNYNNERSIDLEVNVSNVPDTTPPWFDPVLSNQILELGDEFNYDINGTDDYSVDQYRVNDTTRFSIDINGIVTNVSTLALGIYELNVTLNDTSGNEYSELFNITVQDISAPVPNYMPNITLDYNQQLSVVYTATDFSGVKDWSINDSRFDITSSGLLTNATLLDLNNYSILVTITDNLDNSESYSRNIIVRDATIPWFSPIPTTQYVEYGSTFSYDVNAYDDYLFDSYSINDSRFAIDIAGTIINATFLPLGTYPILVTVNDSSSNQNTSSFSIIVQDTTDPVITGIYNITAEYYSEIVADFNATDLSGIKEWTVDSIFFSIDSDGILTNTLQVPQGEHDLTITAIDYGDNSVSTHVLVNITPYTGNLGWNIQHGTTQMQSAATTVNIAEVNPDHAFILVSVSGSSSYDDPDHAAIWGEFVSPTQFVLRQGTGLVNSNTVGWQVIENPQLRVQHYNASFGTTDTAINVPLTKSFDESSSVVFLEYGTNTNTGAGYFPQFVFTGELTGPSVARIKRDDSGTAATVGFFIVEFNDGSTVQTGEIATVGDLSSPSYINLGEAVNTTESWLYFSHASDSTANGLDDIGIYTENIDETTWYVAREATGGTKRMRWYVITTPGAVVQRGNFTVPSTGLYPSAGFNTVNTSRTIVRGSWYNSGAGTTFSNYLTEYDLASSTQIQITREGTGNTHQFGYEVIEFPEQGVTWNTSIINLGIGQRFVDSLSAQARVSSVGANTNVIARCVSGNCTDVYTNYTMQSLGNTETIDVDFMCLNTTTGNFTATYELVSNQDPTADSLTISCEIMPNANVTWNQSTLDLGNTNQGTGNLTSSVLIFGQDLNNNVVVTCDSGSCMEITTNHTPVTLNEGENETVYFTCNEDYVGKHSAIFNVSSAHDLTSDQITILCNVTDVTTPTVIDLKPPQATFSPPGEIVNITVNVTDRNGIDNVRMLMTYNSTILNVNLTDDNLDNIYNYTFTDTTYLGEYLIRIYANDSYGNLNDSEATFFTTSNDPPELYLEYPHSGVGDNDGNILIGYNVSDDRGISNCSLYINGTINQTNTTILENTSISLLISNLSAGRSEWYVNCTDIYGRSNSSEKRHIDVILTKGYSGITTDFSLELDLSNIPNLIIEKPGLGKINYTESVNLLGGADIDSITNISNGFVSVNSSADSRLNKAAEITMESLTYDFSPFVYKDGARCTTCLVKSYSSGNFIFTVDGFSNYTAVPNSEMNIWDSNETIGGGKTVYPGDIVKFYANYTSTQTGLPLSGGGFSCNIEFEGSKYGMSYNVSSGFYEYSRSFPINRTYVWNVTCLGEVNSFENQNLTDSIIVEKPDYPPSVALDYPADNQQIAISPNLVDITFNGTVTEDHGLVNCSFWHNKTGIWHRNQTSIASGLSSTFSFDLLNLNTTRFVWNVECYDDKNQSAFATANRTIIVIDNINPQVTNLNPVNGTNYVAGAQVYINASVTDNHDISYVKAVVKNSLGIQEYIMNDPNNDGIFNASFHALVDGENNITIVAADIAGNENNTETSSITITYTTNGAIYCTESPCIANTSLIQSRGTVSPGEPNQPNTIDTCVDGSSGSYLSDESLENITFRSLNGSEFRALDTVEAIITGYCYSDGSQDSFHYIYGNDSSNLAWKLMASEDPCPGGAIQTVSKTFVLDNITGIQAFRGMLRYQNTGTATCASGSYDDQDDLEFLVLSPREFVNPIVEIGSPIDEGTYYFSDVISLRVNITDDSDMERVYVVIQTDSRSWEINLTDPDLNDEYTGTFSQTYFIGNHTMRVYAEDMFGNQNNSEEIWFNLNDTGTLVINALGCTPSTAENGTSFTCKANATDEKVNISTVIANVTYPNGTITQASVTNVSEIYSFTFSDTEGVGIYSVDWWVNNTNGISRNDADKFRTIEYNIPSVVINEPLTTDLYNTSQTIKINVTATDDVEIDKVIARITRPNMAINVLELTDMGNDIFYGGYINTSLPGNYSIQIIANDTSSNQNNTQYTWVNLTFSTNGAKYCEKSPCRVGSDLIQSRGAMGPGEPNAPNTIDSCSDGTSGGTYTSDESIENITIRSLNGSDFRGLDTIEANITAYCYSSGANDNINFVYANDSASFNWYVAAFVDPCPAGGLQTVSRTFVLDNVTGIQAFRALIGYNGQTTDTCSGGGYDDNDDLEFMVYKAREKIPPYVNFIVPEELKYIANNTIEFVINVTDHTDVEVVYANVSWSTFTETLAFTAGYGSSLYKANFTNTSYLGQYNITVFANDTFNNINASEWRNFTIGKSLYHYFYGNSTVSLSLGKSSDLMFSYGWMTPKAIIMMDNESVFNFDDLQALGIDKLGGFSNQDFAELDEVLQVHTHSDSITKTWAVDNSTAIARQSFVVDGRTIDNVPYVYSTNNSNFITGILWDTADSADNEFDATEGEDIVFITTYNINKQGAYGIYGYEIRVPGNFGDYTGTEDRVMFYPTLS